MTTVNAPYRKHEHALTVRAGVQFLEHGVPSGPITIDKAGTLAGLFQERVRLSPGATAYREFDVKRDQWCEHRWEDICQRVGRIRATLRRAGMQPGDRFAIALPNGSDWVCFDIAALSLGLVVVPLYLHDSPANMAFILSDSGARGLILDGAARWRRLLPHHRELIGLEQVWIRDWIEAEDRKSLHPSVKCLTDPLDHEGDLGPWPGGSPEDTATIIYTSGTTGRPKGVILTHRAILWNATMTAQVVPPLPDDRFLSCLPLAHAFERTVGYYLPMLGGSEVTYARSIEALAEDLRSQRPTVLIAVPRLYERVCLAIKEKARTNLVKRVMLNAAASLGWKRQEARLAGRPDGSSLDRFLWRQLDWWVGAQVRLAFGGRLRVAVSGGAPLPVDVARFLIGLGVPLVEGYGLTEAGPVVTATKVGAFVPGTVGQPLKGVDIEISNRGELLIRSPSIMKGYWKNDALTSETIDPHGWLHTGDHAESCNGRISIRSRLKELIVLSTGEKVAPAEIESAILRDPIFEHALVVGDGKPALAAVLALKAEGWETQSRRLGVSAAEPNNEIVKRDVIGRLERLLNDFARHAQVRAVHLTLDRWTVENGLLTPTLKSKRGPLQIKYKHEIEKLHERAPISELL